MRRKALAIVLTLIATEPARAGDPVRDAMERGNALFKEGKFAEAAAAYEGASGTGAPELLYNLGCAQASAGNLEGAEALFKKAAASPGAAKTGAAARYNLGSVQFKRAGAIAEKQPEGALELLRQSERSFRGALDLDRSDQDAARNIEAVQLAAKAILEKLQKQQEEQAKQQQQQQSKPQDQQNGKNEQKQDQANSGQKDQQKKDPQAQAQKDEQQQNQGNQQQAQQNAQDPQEQLSERLSELADKQQELANKSKELSKQEQESSKRQPGSPSSEQVEKQRRDLMKEQQDLSEETKKASEQLDKLNRQEEKPGKNADAKESMSRARESQQQAEESLKKDDPADAAGAQERAAEQMREASRDSAPQQQEQPGASKPTEEKKQNAEQPPAGQAQASRAEGQGAQPAEATATSQQANGKPVDLVAAQILDKERREQDALKRYLRTLRNKSGKPKPADKDW